MKWKKAVLAGKVLLSVFAFSMSYAVVGQELAERNYQKIYSLIPNTSIFFNSIDAPPFKSLILLLLLIKFYQICDDSGLNGGKRFAVNILAFIASVSLWTGNAIYKYDGLEIMFLGIIQSVKSFIILWGYYLFFQKLFFVMVSGYESFVQNRKYCTGTDFFNEKYAGIIIFMSLLLVWGGVLFIYYPAIFMGDTEDILYMAFNYPTRLIDSVILPREGMYLTNHHPVAYTVFIRVVMEVVRKFGGGTNVRFFCARLYNLL